VIFDTDVFIWYQRGNENAVRVIDEAPSRALSAQSYVELLQGAHSKAHHQAVKFTLTQLQFEILPLNENIGHRALVYIEQFSLSHHLRAGDALIAATAVERNRMLVSGNVKHFRPIADLRLFPFRP
jgi:predicted nucleic acid-binding protein